MDVVQQTGLYAGAAAFFGLAFLIPLYISQARDVRRLREWSEHEPEAASEAVQAAAASARVAHEAAVARATGAAETTRAEVKAAAREAATMTRSAAAERVAADRPAAARTTAQRAAIAAEPAWRRWVRRGPAPRQLVWIVGGVFAFGLAIALISLQLAGDDGSGTAPEPAQRGGVVKANVEVAVLNGTAVPGLAAKVGDDVEANDYALGVVTNSETPAEDSAVLFERGQEDEARAVARDLGIQEVEPADSEARDLGNGADVVVVAGEDRARL